MFNGMYNDGDCGDKINTGCFGGCNCTWILLIILFCCCGGKMRNFTLNINPCCLLLLGALLLCGGGITLGGGK